VLHNWFFGGFGEKVGVLAGNGWKDRLVLRRWVRNKRFKRRLEV